MCKRFENCSRLFKGVKIWASDIELHRILSNEKRYSKQPLIRTCGLRALSSAQAPAGLDFHKIPSSDFIWSGTKDLSRLRRSQSAACGQKRFAPLAKRSTCSKSTAGYPNKNSNNRKIVSARGTIGRGKNGSFLSFSLPSCPARLLFSFFPASLRHRDLCGGERVWELAGRNSTLNTQKYKNLFTQANQAGSYVLVTVKLR